MMNAHVANLLNEQINKEFYSALICIWTLPTILSAPDWPALRIISRCRPRRNGTMP